MLRISGFMGRKRNGKSTSIENDIPRLTKNGTSLPSLHLPVSSVFSDSKTSLVLRGSFPKLTPYFDAKTTERSLRITLDRGQLLLSALSYLLKGNLKVS
jgi:hypothetical protein